MLSMKEILELSNSMSVETIDNVDNKHYIINECGQSVEFDLDMLMSTNKKLSEEFEELKRLAKIGKAFENAKNEEFGIFEYIPYAGAKTKNISYHRV